MTAPVLICGAALIVVLALVLARELKLRHALQRLLGRVLDQWRNRRDEVPHSHLLDRQLHRRRRGNERWMR